VVRDGDREWAHLNLGLQPFQPDTFQPLKQYLCRACVIRVSASVTRRLAHFGRVQPAWHESDDGSHLPEARPEKRSDFVLGHLNRLVRSAELVA